MTRLPGHAPTWLRDVDATLPVTPTYVLHGNIRDRYLLPLNGTLLPFDLVHALWEALRPSGFEALLHYTPRGVQVVPPAATPIAAEVLGVRPDRVSDIIGPDQLADFLTRIVGNTEHRLALVIDYASQWRPVGERFTDPEHALMQHALATMHTASACMMGEARRSALYNPVFWVVDRPADLPPWLVGGFEGIRQVPVPVPDLTARGEFATLALRPNDHDSAPVQFAELTEGLTIRAMMEILQLSRDQGLPRDRIDDAVRSYRVGLLENPWAREGVRERVRAASKEPGNDDDRKEGDQEESDSKSLSDRVLGQERAVRHALDILIRSVTGMTGAERGGGSGGPRGILFFAGPTGVGKTELAKSLAALVFGDEKAMIRFDMSEFSSEHTEARLIGSPPGYIGHGEGGELTNGVRQKPFSLVLFDEVEKAHPRILDKFLQILSDGRLTDGSGDTVHFSESLIVFTSNLGVPPWQPDHEPPRGAELERLVRAEIEAEFRHSLKRPELLGRIGQDNIVVFDYISREVAERLAHRFIDNTIAHVQRLHDVTLTMAQAVRTSLVESAIDDLSLGGRGIAGAIESNLVNPLARELFALDPNVDAACVEGIVWEEEGWHTLQLTPMPAMTC